MTRRIFCRGWPTVVRKHCGVIPKLSGHHRTASGILSRSNPIVRQPAAAWAWMFRVQILPNNGPIGSARFVAATASASNIFCQRETYPADLPCRDLTTLNWTVWNSKAVFGVAFFGSSAVRRATGYLAAPRARRHPRQAMNPQNCRSD